MNESDARRFVADRHQGVLVTLKASDGRPQLSNIMYGYTDGLIRVSVTDDRAKTRNLRHDPRVSLYVTSDDFWTYVVAEGEARLSPLTTEAGDETGRALLDVYETIRGEPHPDPDEFFGAMVEERRLVLSFAPTYLYPVS